MTNELPVTEPQKQSVFSYKMGSGEAGLNNSKKNFQLLKQKITDNKKLQEIHDQKHSSATSEEDEALTQQIIIKNQYRLVVSSDSSDSFEEQIEHSPGLQIGLEERVKVTKALSTLKSAYQDKLTGVDGEQDKASKNWKYIAGGSKPQIIKQQQTTSILTQISSVNYMTTPKPNIPGERKSSQDRSTPDNGDRLQSIVFLKGLEQNKVLDNLTSIDETFEQNKIVIKVKTKDFFSFIRLEHEADELRRKQNDFNNHRKHIQDKSEEKHLEQMQTKLKMEQEQKDKKFNKSWFVGIALAKRFLKKGRKKNGQQDVNLKLMSKQPSKVSSRASPTASQHKIKVNQQEFPDHDNMKLKQPTPTHK